MAKTSFTKRCEILADLWMYYRDDQNFEDFIQYNDIGLPLAYAIANDIVPSTDTAEQFINETFELFLKGLEQEDIGFESLGHLLMLEE